MTYEWIQNAGLLVALGLVVWLWVRLGRVEARLENMRYVVGVKEAPTSQIEPTCSTCKWYELTHSAEGHFHRCVLPRWEQPIDPDTTECPRHEKEAPDKNIEV